MSYDYREHVKAFIELNDGGVTPSKHIVAVYVMDSDLPNRSPHCYWVCMVDTDDGKRCALSYNRERAYVIHGEYNHDSIMELVGIVNEHNPEITVLGYSVVEIVDLNTEHVQYLV